MKKLVLAIFLAMFGVTTLGTLPSDCTAVYAQKKGGDKKKDPPGPPVVRDKPKDKPGDSKPKDDKPRKGKKPDEL
ncbi:MAG TPA: hypothetical protein VLD57_12720 [Blastocatellia bacterium]|nr:hypothetical protein [Blastocatellia bacterium]